MDICAVARVLCLISAIQLRPTLSPNCSLQANGAAVGANSPLLAPAHIIILSFVRSRNCRLFILDLAWCGDLESLFPALFGHINTYLIQPLQSAVLLPGYLRASVSDRSDSGVQTPGPKANRNACPNFGSHLN